MKSKTNRTFNLSASFGMGLLFLIPLTLCLCSGCVSSARTDAMQARPVINHRHAATVGLRVIGQCAYGNQVQVSNDALRAALEKTITDCGLFSGIRSAEAADHLLEVTVMGYGTQGPGIKMKTTLTTRWKLSRRVSSELLFNESIHKEFVATVSDAFDGTTRWRVSNERVVRDSIEEGMRRLAELKL